MEFKPLQLIYTNTAYFSGAYFNIDADRPVDFLIRNSHSDARSLSQLLRTSFTLGCTQNRVAEIQDFCDPMACRLVYNCRRFERL